MSEPQTSEPIAFKAEIRQLLDILVHSLYKEREIFLRELISNASDALNRARFEMLTNREVVDPDAELAIHITINPDEKTIAITDSGIGMTSEELIENLGTIAHSGARAFIDAAGDTKSENGQNLSEIIGQFGVGFYSVFMAAEWVRVTSRSYQPGTVAASWYATGEGTYTVEPAEKAERGTTILIKLNEESAEFASEFKIKDIVKRHSNYVQFPIYVTEEKEASETEAETKAEDAPEAPKAVNEQEAVWRKTPKDVDEKEHEDFYKQLTLDFEAPLKNIHLLIDAPLRLYALLYIPGTAERGMFSLRKEDGLKLYARKVLIQEYTTDLLPEHYRFIQGVVDAEDLPLNVSRETVQSNALMARVKKILTGRVTGTLKKMASNTDEPEAYTKFWENFGPHIKQGVATDTTDRESLYPLLRFKTTKDAEAWSSLNDYVGRMKPGQKQIFFILGDDPSSVTRSPHLDYFSRHGYEVLVLTEAIDSFMLMGLQEYEGFKLQNVAAADLELPEPDKDAEKDEEGTSQSALSEEDMTGLVARFKEQLGERVSDVRTTERLATSIARLVDPDGTMNQEMQRVYKLLEREYETPKKVLELNPKHTTLEKLSRIEGDDELSANIIEQIYESALLIEGLHPDPASMIPRIEALMKAALK